MIYPALANSPEAHLTATYTPEDGSIAIDLGECLPPAPNLLTIGDTEASGTYLYTGKSAATGAITVTGLEFVEGVDQARSAGTVVARRPTAHEHTEVSERLAFMDAWGVETEDVTGDLVFSHGT